MRRTNAGGGTLDRVGVTTDHGTTVRRERRPIRSGSSEHRAVLARHPTSSGQPSSLGDSAARVLPQIHPEAKHSTARGENVMKTIVTGTLIAAAWLLSGCASDSLARWNSLFVATAPPSRILKPYLLFDRHAGVAHPSDFTARRDWPSVEYGYTVRERILFTERTYDYQGRSRGGDGVRRRFTTYRTGLIVR